MVLDGYFFLVAASTAICTSSLVPFALVAAVEVTGTPKSCDSFLVSMVLPDFSKRSAMFRAMTTGVPISRIWVVR